MIGDIALGLAVGVPVGLVFFGGLRWTLTRLEDARRPMALMLGSLVVRIAILAAALVGLAGGSLTRVLAAVAGLLVVRTVMVFRARRGLEAQEVSQWT